MESTKIFIENIDDKTIRKVTTKTIVTEEIIKVDDLIAKRDAIIKERDEFIETVVKVDLFRFQQRILAVEEEIEKAKADGATVEVPKEEKPINAENLK